MPSPAFVEAIRKRGAEVVQQTGNRYRLELFADRPDLAGAIASRNAQTAMVGASGTSSSLMTMEIPAVPGLPAPAQTATPGNPKSKIQNPKSNDLPDPGRTLLEAARESGAQVRGFRPALRSLEDIFLEAVE